METDLRDRIRRCAYERWDREGRPVGRELDHWLWAETQVSASREKLMLGSTEIDTTKDPERQRLEREKLDAEIRELNERIKDLRSGSRSDFWKLMVTAVGIAVPLVVGIPTALIQFNTFLEQRRAEQTFEVSREMIDLIQQLNDPSSPPTLQRAAAISLSFLGDPAIPLLVNNLYSTGNRDVYETTIDALEEVLARQNDPHEVLDPVLQAAERVVQRELHKPQPQTLPVRVYMEAVVRMANAAKVRLSDGEWENAKDNVVERLRALQAVVQASSSLQVQEKDELSCAFEAQVARVVGGERSEPCEDDRVTAQH